MRVEIGLYIGVKKNLRIAQTVIMLFWKVSLYFADLSSDFQVLFAILAASKLATTTFNNMTTEAHQANTTVTDAFKSVTDLCPGATHGAFEKLTNLLSKYSNSLLFAMLPNLILQFHQSSNLMVRSWNNANRNNVLKIVKYVVVFPMNNFTKISIKASLKALYFNLKESQNHVW